jgi:hypothetical protein
MDDKQKSSDASRVILVDPNDLHGQSNVPYGSPSYNITPSPEDLSILVELTTKSKARSILITDADGNRLSNEGTNSVISFISGSSINGGNYLSTSYTQLNGDIDEIEEGLGITSIDINFSSSYAPMININFVDLKGGSIFQNGAKGKFGVFFKLPYPIFNLKIKGYYGRPVTYMLHLTKINSKFNSETGNFELAANFVGYTYAILSDMLVGYLKAMSELKAGKDYINSLKAIDPEMMTLNELLQKSVGIKKIIDGIGNNNPAAVELGAIDNILTKNIPNISIVLNNFIDSFDKNLLQNNTIKGVIVAKASDIPQKMLTDYSLSINNAINEYNSLVSGKDTLVIKGDNLTKFTNFLIKTSLSTMEKDLSDASIIRAIKSEGIAYDGMIYVFNINPAILILNQKTSDVTAYKNDTTDVVAIQLKEKLENELHISSTIRFLVKLFCAHIEAFLGAIWDVSAKYNDPSRREQLRKFVQSNGGSNKIDVKTDTVIYPWPEYSENDVEKYLGAAGVLSDPTQVPEVQFVEDLYEAMIKTAGVEQDTLNQLSERGDTWFPCNPLDTKLLDANLEVPYKRLANPTPNNIVNEVIIRAVTFLSLSNRKLTRDEIRAYAEAEANDIYNTLNSINNNNLRGLRIKTPENFITAQINGESILNDKGDYLEYIDVNNSNNPHKFILINKGFEEKMPVIKGNLMLSNFNASNHPKPDDGAVYLKIIEKESYKNENGSAAAPIIYSEISKNLEDYSDEDFKKVGFNALGGSYNIQEFSKVVWSGSFNNFGKLPLFYMFYKDGNNFIDGFVLKRNKKNVVPKIGNETSVIVAPVGGSYVYLKTYEAQTNVHGERGVGNQLLAINPEESVYSFVSFFMNNTIGPGYIPVSLFGSRFYYEQSLEGRAFLFLHTFPWNGLTDDAKEWTFSNTNYLNGIFNRFDIINLFSYRAGFIQVPYLWPAFIGGLLWRKQFTKKNDPIKFTNNEESFLPGLSKNYQGPDTNEYLSLQGNQFSFNYGTAPMSFGEGDKYIKIETILNNIPESVKLEFINDFKKFVSSADWSNIKKELEIIQPNENGSDFVNKFKTIAENSYSVNNNYSIKTSEINKLFINLNNYGTYNFYINAGDFSNLVSLEISDTSDFQAIIKNLYTSYKWVCNTQWNIWGSKQIDNIVGFYINEDSLLSNSAYSPIIVSKNNMLLYLKTFTDTFKTFNLDNKELVKATFGTTENDDIKLNIYKNIKSIYDKWIAGSTSKETIIFNADERIKVKSGDASPRLIDSFKFINRAFNDIGDELLINPLLYNDLLIGSTDQSFYTVLAKLLNDNNMDFIPLPSYINYKSPEELKTAFHPYPYMEASKIADTGPSFICMYIGQPSAKLDFGEDHDHPNDGFDFTSKVPNDFINPSNTSKLSSKDLGAAFVVNYGHQNQNIFKDVQLDQSEFTETAEHLKIMDDLSKQATQLSATQAGQNLYNVYSVRSYKAEIEMLGNAMIQPMMYFQLNNIPMFHGAYIIISTRHNIKPNFMSTFFTGVRIRAVQTPLITAEHLYSVILGDFKSKADEKTALIGITPISKNYVDDYHNLLIQNPPNAQLFN